MNKKMLQTQDEAYKLYVKGYSQQRISEELKVSQPTISRLLGKKKKSSLHDLGKQSAEEFLDAYNRAKEFFDELLVQIDNIETDDVALKLRKINDAATMMEKSLYLASQGRYMQFVQYTNEMADSHELHVAETSQLEDKRELHYQ